MIREWVIIMGWLVVSKGKQKQHIYNLISLHSQRCSFGVTFIIEPRTAIALTSFFDGVGTLTGLSQSGAVSKSVICQDARAKQPRGVIETTVIICDNEY